MQAEEFLAEKPVFTNLDLDEYLGSMSPGAYWSRVAFLARLKRDGRVVKVRRGLFASVPRGLGPDLFPVDHCLVAAKLTRDAVVTYATALECLGLADQRPGEATYSAGRPLNPVLFRDRLYRGVKFPKSLVRRGLERMMVRKVPRAGSILSVASAERTLVDLADRPDLVGGWSATVRLLDSLDDLDLDQVVEYTRALGNSTTAAKVGWYLTMRREALGVGEGHLAALAVLKPNQPHYIDRSRRRDGRLVADWNLIVTGEE